jgi:hypothetical protein
MHEAGARCTGSAGIVMEIRISSRWAAGNQVKRILGGWATVPGTGRHIAVCKDIEDWPKHTSVDAESKPNSGLIATSALGSSNLTVVHIVSTSSVILPSVLHVTGLETRREYENDS